MRKAIIRKNKVINIIECGEGGLVGIQLPLGCIIWDCTQIPVAIGDDFRNGAFSRGGQAVEPLPSSEQRIAELEAMVAELREQIGGVE